MICFRIAVLMSEIVKLLTCLVVVFYEEDKNIQRFTDTLHRTVIVNIVDTMKVCVPSMVYIVQNNLLYLSASHLDAATYQVTYQLKILTTAMFAVLILKKRLQSIQWTALILLVFGIALVQLAHTNESSPSDSVMTTSTTTVLLHQDKHGVPKDPTDQISVQILSAAHLNGRNEDNEQKSSLNLSAPEQNRMLGLWAALGACVLSGFAGIYFEKILKGATISVWMRNVQLSLLSIPFGAVMCLINDGSSIREKGFFFGYDLFIWYLVVLQAGGGLIVAIVVKYADNILKGFATSLAIIFSCIASIYIFAFRLTTQFTVGASLVIVSIYLYSGGIGKTPQSKPTPVKTHIIPIPTTTSAPYSQEFCSASNSAAFMQQSSSSTYTNAGLRPAREI